MAGLESMCGNFGVKASCFHGASFGSHGPLPTQIRLGWDGLCRHGEWSPACTFRVPSLESANSSSCHLQVKGTRRIREPSVPFKPGHRL